MAALERRIYFGTDRGFSRAPDVELAGFAAGGSTRGARGAPQPYLDDLDRLGDTHFLADPKPWIEGTRFDITG